MELSYNKGEWAEFYAFLEILSTGKLYAADENLEKITTVYYSALKIIKDNIEYAIDNTNIVINDGQGRTIVPISDVIVESEKILLGIKNGEGRSFEIPNITNFINRIKITTLKAGSTSKGDLLIKIHDDRTGFEPELSFSIKSYIGGKPSLLNASGATKINFKLSKPLALEQMNECNELAGGSKIKDRISFLQSLGVNLLFDTIPDPTFAYNLQMIDYRMPELLSLLYLESYFVKGKRMKDVVNSFIAKNPQENLGIVEYKVKELLVAIALGLVPKTKWTGSDEATGGYIVVKEDGEVLCYHIYDRNKLKEYLYNNTRFDTPKTERTGAGLVESTASFEQQQFGLTVQIRF